VVEIAFSTKFLGVHVNNQLNWNDHVENIFEKTSQFPFRNKKCVCFTKRY